MKHLAILPLLGILMMSGAAQAADVGLGHDVGLSMMGHGDHDVAATSLFGSAMATDSLLLPIPFVQSDELAPIVFEHLSVENGAFTTLANASDIAGRQGFRLQAGQEAVRLDKAALQATQIVPEAAIWAMMLVGFVSVGYVVRGRKERVNISFG